VDDKGVAEEAHVGLIQIKHKRKQWDEVAKLMSVVETHFPQAINAPELKDAKIEYEQFKAAKKKEEESVKKQEDERQRMVEQQRQRAEALAAARLAALNPPVEKEEVNEVPPSQLAVLEEEKKTPENPSELSVELNNNNFPFDKALSSARQIALTNSETAISRYWDAINLGDKSGIAFYELARVYYNRNQYNEAEMTSLEALRREPKDNRYLMTYLTVIRKTKAKPDFVAEIRKYRQLYPKNGDLILLLARTYAEPGGDANAARSLYDLFFKIAPTHPETERARYEVRGI
jgi:tetratricopeptide (TPR) repeat protein